MRVLIAFALLVVLLAALLLLGVYTGFYDVAADAGQGPFTHWAFRRTMEESVRRRAADIDPPALDDPARLHDGAAHYRENCEICHAGPGIEESEVHQGLEPAAPDLTEAARDWGDAELFWIAKHGIRMTGMPAFGVTHDDEELWDTVAFVRELPGMSAARYAELTSDAAEHHHHDHDEGEEGEAEGAHEHG